MTPVPQTPEVLERAIRIGYREQLERELAALGIESDAPPRPLGTDAREKPGQ